MASQADYKDRQFLAVIGDEVCMPCPAIHPRIAISILP